MWLGAMTSDDVELITSEIKKGVNYQYQVGVAPAAACMGSVVQDVIWV